MMALSFDDSLVGSAGHQCHGRGHGQVQTQALPAHRCGMYLSLSLAHTHMLRHISLSVSLSLSLSLSYQPSFFSLDFLFDALLSRV